MLHLLIKVSHDKIKTMAPNTKFTWQLDIFNTIEQNSWLIIGNLAESIDEWSQEMLQLFTFRYHHEKFP